jgi:hypothetical protein
MILVKNPTSKDFTVTYDVHGDLNVVPFTVPCFGILRIDDAHLANHVASHLAKHIVLNVDGIKTNFEDDYNKTLKEIIEYV